MSDPQDNDVVRTAVRQVELAEARARRLGYAFLSLVAAINLGAAGIATWNTYRIKELAQAQHDFAQAHAEASYQRAQAGIRVVECADDWFFDALVGGKPPPRARLDECFRAPITPATEVPLAKEPTK